MTENNEQKITWKANNTNPYVNGIYAGYIDSMPSGRWYGKVCFDDGYNTMTSMPDITNTQQEMMQMVEDFIRENFDNVLATATRIYELNKK